MLVIHIPEEVETIDVTKQGIKLIIFIVWIVQTAVHLSSNGEISGLKEKEKLGVMANMHPTNLT
jgi:hypothetical protein